MNRSGIEWCDHTFNPITGCLTGCPYCYARKMVARFAGDQRFNLSKKDQYRKEDMLYQKNMSEITSATLYYLDDPFIGENGEKVVYPFGFDPTFHKYRLDTLDGLKSGCKVFVGAMADIFGPWVPDFWIEMTMKACMDHPNNQYLFLTKWPKRYEDLIHSGKLPKLDNFWYGTSCTRTSDEFFAKQGYNCWLSVEPILEEFPEPLEGINRISWIVMGAETGNRKEKVVPEKRWIDEILQIADRHKIPVFMKDSLQPIVNLENMRKDYPEEMIQKKPGPGWKKLRYAKCLKCGKEYQKGEMATIEARWERGSSAQILGHICQDCFEGWKKEQGFEVSKDE